VKPYDRPSEKIAALLYAVAGTQSRPKIDHLADFYRALYNNEEKLNSFEGFFSVIKPDLKIPNYQSLFEGMQGQKGWGKKTAALLTKSVYHLHSGEYGTGLRIWQDAPVSLDPGELFYLPVDSVILSIFSRLQEKQWTFSSINNTLKEHKYPPSDIEVFDDL
jgi:hypothetical protein